MHATEQPRVPAPSNRHLVRVRVGVARGQGGQRAGKRWTGGKYEKGRRRAREKEGKTSKGKERKGNE